MDRFCGLTWSSVVSPQVLCLSFSTGQIPGSGDSGGDEPQFRGRVACMFMPRGECVSVVLKKDSLRAGGPQRELEVRMQVWDLGPQGRAGWGPPGAASAGSPLRLPLDRVYPNACSTQTLPQPKKSLGIWANPA